MLEPQGRFVGAAGRYVARGHRPGTYSGRAGGQGECVKPGEARRCYASRTAFSEMAAFISLEIGQPVFALFAAVSNASWLAPGTRAVVSR